MKLLLWWLALDFILLTILHINSVHCKARYLLYYSDLELGFNKNKDVYIELATLMKRVREHRNCIGRGSWMVVLPPWKSDDKTVTWSKLFNISSLYDYVPVLEFSRFADLADKVVIDEAWFLQASEKSDPTCNIYTYRGMEERSASDPPYYLETTRDGHEIRARFFGERGTYVSRVKCVSARDATAAWFADALCDAKLAATSVLIDHADLLLAAARRQRDVEFWNCRRSMLFARELIEAAGDYRASMLGSTERNMESNPPVDWRKAECELGGRGGPYVAAHVRWSDVRDDGSGPILDDIAGVLRWAVRNRTGVFVAFVTSDASYDEMSRLKLLVPELQTWTPSDEQLDYYTRLGVAVIKQIISSHASFFVGTRGSGYSLGVQQERDMMCFEERDTYNDFFPLKELTKINKDEADL